jgi:hypothetical protein
VCRLHSVGSGSCSVNNVILVLTRNEEPTDWLSNSQLHKGKNLHAKDFRYNVCHFKCYYNKICNVRIT